MRTDVSRRHAERRIRELALQAEILRERLQEAAPGGRCEAELREALGAKADAAMGLARAAVHARDADKQSADITKQSVTDAPPTAARAVSEEPRRNPFR